jgi:hypothetical protein
VEAEKKLSESARLCRNRYSANWKRNHRDKIREYNRIWRKDHPQKVREYNRRFWERRAEKESQAEQRKKPD